jgi:hypothetical protein
VERRQALVAVGDRLAVQDNGSNRKGRDRIGYPLKGAAPWLRGSGGTPGAAREGKM